MTRGNWPTGRPRVYFTGALLLALAGFAAVGSRPARGQIDLTVNPAMTKGKADAPVTIVEFADYQ